MRSLSSLLRPAAVASLLAISTSAALAQIAPEAQSAVSTAFGNLPLSFEPNQGQADPEVRFLSRGAGYSLFLTDSGAVLSLGEASSAAQSPSPSAAGSARNLKPAARHAATPDVVRIELIGANHPTQAEAASPLPGVVSYFIGNDPAKWRTNIPTYARVKYQSVYPGVDLVYYGNQGRLEYDFVVASGADANAIRFRLSGAKALAIDNAGNLQIKSTNGSLQINNPVVYQEENGVRQRVDGHFQRMGADTIGFQIGRYNRALPLTIDPVLIYSTFLGGSGNDSATSLAVDAAGNAYITGTATSSDFPTTTGAYQTHNKAGWGGIGPWAGTVFVSKLNAAGTALIYSTFLGGSEFDHGLGIAIDSSGNAYIAGYTDSSDFPTTTGVVQPKTHASSSSDYTGFVTKLNAAGTALDYSTYLGGSGGPAWAGGDGYFYGGDSANAIAVDSKGNAYVGSTVESKDFPTTKDAFHPLNLTAASDGLTGAVTKLNPQGTALVYSTYLGGSGLAFNNPPYGDTVNSIALDESGNVYVTGLTGSPDFPVTKGAYQTAIKTIEAPTAFVTKLNSTGSGLVYSTYLGGTVIDQAYGIALDSSDNAYIVGQTSSGDFPVTKAAFETTYPSGNPLFSGNETDFVTKLNPDGTALVYSTYLGGSVAEWNYGGIAVDASGSVYIAGQTWSLDFPVTQGAYTIAMPTSRPTGFLSRLNPAGSALLYSTYLGGSYQDAANAVANAGTGIVIVAGSSNSSDFPVTSGAFQTENHGCGSGLGYCTANPFVTKLDTGVLVARPAVKVTLSSSANPAIVGTNVTVTATVSGGSNTIPEGQVLFTADGLLQADPVTSGGTASFTISSLANGKHTITAQFRASDYNLGSASLILTEGPVAAPVISPAGGGFSSPQSVKITDASPGTIILYTTDGSTPTIDSNVYRGPVTVASREILNANAAVAGADGNYLFSSVSSAAFSFPGAPLTSPASNTVLAGPKVTFTWSAFSGATKYFLRVGTSIGANNLYASGPITATSATATSLPTNGEKIYARLYTYVGTYQLYADYAFTAATQAALTAPTPDTLLAGPKVTFTWSAATGDVTSYFFRLGTSLGAGNLYASGPVTTTSVTLANLPANGETIYARLYTVYASGAQKYSDYTLTAATQAAIIEYPPGTVLPGTDLIFSWSAATGNVTGYYFRLGTSVGAYNVFSSGPLTAATTSVEPLNLPSNGEKIYARLYTSYASGAQAYTDFTYTAYKAP